LYFTRCTERAFGGGERREEEGGGGGGYDLCRRIKLTTPD
jgi:hypothetical protein